MYYVRKRLEVSAAHRLELSYESKCSTLHGHNWIITIECRSKELNSDGMVADFTHIKSKIMGMLDHKVINDVVPSYGGEYSTLGGGFHSHVLSLRSAGERREYGCL